MASDQNLADRIRQAVGPRPDVTEKKMFGGLAFLQNGKMFVGIVKEDLMVRVGPKRYDVALAEAHVRPMDFTGRPMVGYVFVGPGGSRTEKAVKKWVERGSAFVETLEKSAGTAPMARYALLLRGVNVGTKNSLPMAELRAMLTNLGCTDVQTYVQSGNAVFGTNLGAVALRKAIEGALERYMGRPIATTLRTLAELKAIVDGNPFANVATNPRYLCVTFLSNAPTKSEVAPLHAQDFKPELFRVAGKEIYTWHPNGQGQSPLREALWKLPLRGTVTTRNWNTVLKLREMLDDG